MGKVIESRELTGSLVTGFCKQHAAFYKAVGKPLYHLLRGKIFGLIIHVHAQRLPQQASFVDVQQAYDTFFFLKQRYMWLKRQRMIHSLSFRHRILSALLRLQQQRCREK